MTALTPLQVTLPEQPIYLVRTGPQKCHALYLRFPKANPTQSFSLRVYNHLNEIIESRLLFPSSAFLEQQYLLAFEKNLDVAYLTLESETLKGDLVLEYRMIAAPIEPLSAARKLKRIALK